MTRTMYDSTNARDIPTSAAMVAGYLDGDFAWAGPDWNRFPKADRVGIVVHASTNAGDVLDVESGDATPAQTPAWITMRKAAGLWRPSIYCASSSMPAVREACSAAGVDGFDFWAAQWSADGSPHSVAGAAATQYANPSHSGGHFDLSVVVDDGWPHRGGAMATIDDVFAVVKNIEQLITSLDAAQSNWVNPMLRGDPGTITARILGELADIRAAVGAGSGGTAPTHFTGSLEISATPTT